MHLNNLMAVILLVGLAGCNLKPPSSTTSLPLPSATTTEDSSVVSSELTPSAVPTLAPTRLLTICLGREPTTLFYYDATSIAAQGVLAAVYDGPIDIQNYIAHPVILEKIPSLADGDALIQSVEVTSGDLIADRSGNPVTLETGVIYRPSSCTEAACAETYEPETPVQMDQLVLRFKLLPGLQWSDGTPLTSADSVYSYEIARSLYPTVQPELISQTQSYKALDETTVEWTGLPGYRDSLYHAKFFIPLPQHAWNTFSAEELRIADVATRKPLGWGPYVIDDWVSGDHISLHKNPLYFRAGEGLPHFDNLVYRFVDNGAEALDALLAGECDFVDQTSALELQSQRLSELQKDNRIQTFVQNDAAWEQILFGITPVDNQRQQIFALKEARQAVATCIDREALVAEQPSGEKVLSDVYTSPSNPLYDSELQHYKLDLQKASDLLESIGWLDSDNNPKSPRIAQGVSGITDGTPFEVEYLVSPDSGEQADALAIQAMLGQCGIQITLFTQQPQEYLAAGPEGPVFGRSFDLAQFAWAGAFEPPCYLYLTNEIPGTYPEFPKGWGGVNASGYTNPEYDQACENALHSLPDTEQHQAEHLRAQEIFSADLPALPLYFRSSIVAARPDLCHYPATSATDRVMWSLEALDYGSGCSQ